MRRSSAAIAHPIVLFTGQWADLPLEEVAAYAGRGVRRAEVARGAHLHIRRARTDDAKLAEFRAVLDRHELQLFAISNHPSGQAVCDDPIDFRHRPIVPSYVARRGGGGRPAAGRAGSQGHHRRRPEARDRHGRRLHGLGDVPWDDCFRALRHIGYSGPISVEWEDAGMDRLVGAAEAVGYVRSLLWELPTTAFDAAFSNQH